jgi:hypothetical protein
MTFSVPARVAGQVPHAPADACVRTRASIRRWVLARMFVRKKAKCLYDSITGRVTHKTAHSALLQYEMVSVRQPGSSARTPTSEDVAAGRVGLGTFAAHVSRVAHGRRGPVGIGVCIPTRTALRSAAWRSPAVLRSRALSAVRPARFVNLGAEVIRLCVLPRVTQLTRRSTVGRKGSGDCRIGERDKI